MAVNRTALTDCQHAEDTGCEGDPGEDEHHRPVERMRLTALPPQDRQDRDGHGAVDGRQQQQRHAVEENCFGCLAQSASTIRGAKWYAP